MCERTWKLTYWSLQFPKPYWCFLFPTDVWVIIQSMKSLSNRLKRRLTVHIQRLAINPIKVFKCKLALVFLWQKPAGSCLLCCSSALNVHRLLLNYDKGTYTFIIEELCNKTWQLNLLIMLMQFSIRFDFKQFTKNICSKLLWTS